MLLLMPFLVLQLLLFLITLCVYYTTIFHFNFKELPEFDDYAAGGCFVIRARHILAIDLNAQEAAEGRFVIHGTRLSSDLTDRLCFPDRPCRPDLTGRWSCPVSE